MFALTLCVYSSSMSLLMFCSEEGRAFKESCSTFVCVQDVQTLHQVCLAVEVGFIEIPLYDFVIVINMQLYQDCNLYWICIHCVMEWK